MEIRCFIDPDTDLPHFVRHGVKEDEVRQVVKKPLEQRKGREDSIVVIGRTEAGRFLKVIYVPDDDGKCIFVVTAYPIGPNQMKALKRRMKRRRS